VDCKHAFAVWLTGLPASGKSTVARALEAALRSEGLNCAVLESDALRDVFTPHPRYDDEERDTFYRQMVYIGRLLVSHGVTVIFDATANRRGYRESARQEIARFVEVYVDTPLEVCMSRDPKGIYRAAGTGRATTVPGLQAGYEPPLHPDLTIHGDSESPEDSANQIIAALVQKGYVG